jgi:predicted HTH transcriptional regulator
MAFILRNLRHVQSGASFNSLSELEIPEAVFEELLVNALVHRDYFINAPIRLMIFTDRVEITSPGCLPNHLDAEQIRYGVSNLRNSALASHAFYLLPYSGLGSGIPRAAAAWQDIEFINDQRVNQFRAVVLRKPDLSGEITQQVPTSSDKASSLSQQAIDVLKIAQNEATRASLQEASGLKNREYFINSILKPLLERSLIEMSYPDKPRSSKQRYILTEAGRHILEKLG